MKESLMSQSRHENNRPLRPLSTTQSIIAGSIVGGIEVCVNHPLWSIKTMLQRHMALSFHPTILYRGLSTNAASMVPITAVQVTLKNTMQLHVPAHQQTSINAQFSCAFAAGIGSSMITCPVELVMTKQNASGYHFVQTCKHIMQMHGLSSFYRGLSATMLREGTFTATYLAAVPTLSVYYKNQGMGPYFATFTAGVSAGLLSTLMTHGIDVIKTTQQANLNAAQLNIIKQAKNLYQQHGLFAFTKGIIPRGIRIISAVSLMGYFNEKITQSTIR
jgi:solute carrier family 25 citrate transporter 1